MRALYARSPGDYGLTTQAVPEARADEALVRVSAAAICPNEDRLRRGTLTTVTWPVIPGHQFAGTVETCGAAVERIRAGDRVAVHPYVVCGQCPVCRGGGPTHDCPHMEMIGMSRSGGFAEYCAVPARYLYRLPEGVSDGAGALIENAANAASAVRNARVRWSHRVVVFGSWSLAMLAVQLARMQSPRTLILAGTGGRRLALAEILGADATVNVGADDAGRRLHDLLDGRGADAAILCGPSADDLAVAADLVAPRGRIVVDGHVDPRASLRLPPVGWLVARDVTVTANRGFMTPDYNAAHRLVQDGRLLMETLVTCRFPLDDWAEAFAAFVDPERQSVQVLMEP